MKERSVELRRQAQEAKEQGREEVANRLLAQSEELTRRLESPEAKRGPEEYIRGLRERLEQLDQASDQAAAAGNPARAKS